MAFDFDDEALVKYYNQGLTGLQISKIMGCSKTTVFTHAKRLAADGRIICKNAESPFQEARDNRKAVVLKLLNENKTTEEIMEITSLSKFTIGKYIGELKREGLVEYERTKKPIKTLCFGQTCEPAPTLQPGETIKCTAAVARKCVYGKDKYTNLTNLCNFSLITGHCRSLGPNGCDYKACTRFSAISKDNPRLVCRC